MSHFPRNALLAPSSEHPVRRLVSRFLASPAGPAVAAPNEPEWTLEQYASLCAELEMAPERAQDTLHRYRVRTEQKAQLDTLWAARMRADATLHAAFHHAKTTYASWLMQTRRGS